MTVVDLAQYAWLLLAALGLNLVVGHAGQPMLGQGAFFAAGGYGTVLLADRAGWPIGGAAAAVVAACGLAGWFLARAAARLTGPFLALATWGLAWLVFAVLVAFPGTFGGEQGLVRPTPELIASRPLGLDVALTPAWHLGLAGVLCLLVIATTWLLRSGPLGLDLAAGRESPAVAESLGVRLAVLRRGSVAAAAALGAVAGAGSTVLLGVIAPNDVSPLLSVELLVAVLLAGSASVLAPVVTVALLRLLPTVATEIADGLGAPPVRTRGLLVAGLLVAVLALREPVRALVAPSLSRVRVRWRARRHYEIGSDRPPFSPGTLRADRICLAYGAVQALDELSLEVRPGEVHALIGPNGSGKTSALRVLAGTLPGDAGLVSLDGRDVTQLRGADRARAGIARTFQRTVLLTGLNVWGQVRVGARCREPVGAVRALLRTPTAQAVGRRSSRAVSDALQLAGLTEVAHRPATALAYGEQRLLQVARAAATGAPALLLDEPAAGMSPGELDQLATALRALAAHGRGILLVEHNMRFVAAVADRVTVLVEGRVLMTGPPDAVRRDPAVRAAYLGSAA